jgi:hypothetical protein
MKCTGENCEEELKEPLKYMAYYVNGKPVYFKLCDGCVKKKYLPMKENHAFLSNALT